MLSSIIIRSAAAFGGAPFRLNKCTALSPTAGGAAGGAAVGGVPGALVGGALGCSESVHGGAGCVEYCDVDESDRVDCDRDRGAGRGVCDRLPEVREVP